MSNAAAANRPILKDSDNSWNRVPYQVEFGKSFTTMADALRYLLDVENGDIKHYGSIGMNLNDDKSLSEATGVPEMYMSKPYFKDTRLGANDAINCLWQFNRDDDIVHDMMRSEAGTGIGMGRVYASTIEQNQTIAWFTFGVPKFTKLDEFYTNAIKSDLVQLNNTGFLDAKSDTILGEVFGTLGMLAFEIPLTPFRWLSKVLQRMRNYEVNRFYDLRTTMHLYYKFVDSIMAEWLVTTGVFGNGFSIDEDSVPLSIAATGSNIFDILARKATLLGVDPGKNRYWTDVNINSIIKKGPELYDGESALWGLDSLGIFQVDEESAPWSGVHVNWSELVAKTAVGASQFVGFRVEKSTDASESFSNSTTPSEFADQINAKSKEMANKAFNFGFDGSQMNTGSETLDSLLGGAAGILKGVTDSFKLDGLATIAMGGGAFIDIPEHFSGSDFNKSHSLNFQLRSPYGDISSIYQSIIVPLALILAGALPKAAGQNSYTSPFLCRVYCRGMFSIPLGIIDSVSIRRGSSEFGWTYQNLPTCVDVSLTIKDLSPAMYMYMADEGFLDIMSANSAFKEYLTTLSGIGVFERISRYEQIKRNTQLAIHKLKNRVFNPNFHASWIADSTIAQSIAAFSPWNAVPH